MKSILKKSFIAAVFAVGAVTISQAQVKIGDNPSTINPSAALEIESTNKGFLPPRVALTGISDVATIPSPAKGLIVYNENGTIGSEGIYVNVGTATQPKWSLLSATVNLGLSNNVTVGTTVSVGGILDGTQNTNKLTLTRADGAVLSWWINSTSASTAVRHPLVMAQTPGVSKYAVTSYASYGNPGDGGSISAIGAHVFTTSVNPSVLTTNGASVNGLLPNALDTYVYYIQNTQTPWDSYRIETTTSPNQGTGGNYTITVLRRR